MISRLLLIILSIITLPHALSVVAPPEECEPTTGAPGCVTVSIWSTALDEEHLIVYRTPLSGVYVDDDEIAWKAKWTPFCEGNVANEFAIDDAMCVGAQSACGRFGSNVTVAMYMILSQVIPGSPRHVIGPICFISSTVSLGPIIQELVEDEIGADPPPITLQPTDALVNFPMIAYTDAREPVVVPIEDPIVGTATATPEFVWSFAEGAAAHGPGLPYDGTSPTANPGYYVSYTYGSLGTPTIGLTVTWRVVFTMPGEPPVPLDDVIRENSATTTVRAAGSELIS